MKLSPQAENFADSYYWQESRKIYEDARKELLTRKFISHEDTAQADYSIRMQESANRANARIQSYIKAYEKEGKVIDEEDRNEILAKVYDTIDRDAGMILSGSEGTISMIRSQWSEGYSAHMKEYFINKVKHLIEPSLNDFIHKISEMELNRMLEQNKVKQYEILRWIFDKANGNQYKIIDLLEFKTQHPNYQPEEIENIANYLEGEGLIARPVDEGIFVQITHQGIFEINKTVNNPQSSTNHFPAQIVYNFFAPVGSNQVGNQNTANVQQNFNTNPRDILIMLDELKKHIPDENKISALDYIDGIESEVKSEKPNESRIKLFLTGLGGIVKDTGKEILAEIGKKIILGNFSE